MQEAAGASEKGPMIVNFTITDLTTNPIQLKADTPYADIMEAANAGKIVYAFIPADEGGPLFGQLASASPDSVNFTAFNILGEIMNITMESDSDIFGSSVIGLYRDGVIDSNFDADNQRIVRVKEPVDDSDAATKGYADKILTAGNSDSVVIKSSTPNSTKKFRITVDDAGAITATEVV